MDAIKFLPFNQARDEPWLDTTRYPTAFDIVSLNRFLSQNFPNEIIDMILDLAEYWPHSSCSSSSPVKAQGKARQHVLRSFSAESFRHRGPEATTSQSLTDSSEDGFILRSQPLGVPPTNVVPLQASLVPWTRHPVRMIIFEIRYYCPFSTSLKSLQPLIPGRRSTWLEVGIKKPKLPTESPPRVNLEPAIGPIAQVFEGSSESQRICDRVYKVWHQKRSLCDPAHTKIDLYMDGSALQNGMMGQKTIVWRLNDNDVAGAFLDDGWVMIENRMRRRPEAVKANVNNFMHSLAKEDRRKQASLMKQLEVGDSLDMWVRVSHGSCVGMVEGVRMHVFWAAS